MHVGNAEIEPISGASDLVAVAVGRIAGFIRQNGLRPGDRLPSEATMTQSFGMSRTVVREALRSLAAIRLIDLGAGKRASVASLDESAMAMTLRHGLTTQQIDIRHIHEARRTVETRTAEFAALNRTEEEAEQLLRHARAMNAALGEPALAMQHDVAFHLLIAKASRNPVFSLVVAAFQGVIVETWPLGWQSRATSQNRQAMARTHLELAEAIAHADAASARRLMDDHFNSSLAALDAAGLIPTDR